MAEQSWDDISTFEDEASERPIAEAGGRVGEPTPKTLDELQQAQLDAARINAQRGGMDAKQFQTFLMQRNTAPNVLARINRLEKIYQQKLKGKEKGTVYGYGGEANIGGWIPGAIRGGNKKFNNAADALMGDLIQLYDTTGGEVNSLAELRTRFGPLLPASNDTDENIQAKIDRLKQTVEGQIGTLDLTSRQMGILPPEEGGIPYTGPQLEPEEPDEDEDKGEDTAPVVRAPGDPTQPGGGITTVPPPQFDPATGERMEVAAGEFKTVPNPQRAGANARLDAMVRGGASDEQIEAAMRDYGVPEAELPARMQEVGASRAHFKANPKYKGSYFDIETMKVPTTGWERQAASPLGAAGMAAADTLTGSHMDNIIAAAGGDPEAANRAMAATREANPGAAMGGDIMGGISQYLLGAQLLKGLGAGIGALRAPTTVAGATPIDEILAAGAAPEAAAIAQAERTGIAPTVKNILGNPAGALAPKALAGDVAQGAFQASGQGGTQLVDWEKAGQGGFTGLISGAPVRAAGNVAGAAVSPSGGALAPLYEAGVQPSVGQRMAASSNPLARIGGAAEEMISRIPGLGEMQALTRQRAIDQMQRGALNETLGELKPFEKIWAGISKLPDNMMKGTEAQGRVKSVFNKAYDKARAGMRLRGDPDLDAGLDELRKEMPFLSPDSARVLGNHIKAFEGILKAGKGVMTGDKYKNFVSKLGQRAALQAKKDPELAAEMFSLRQHIDDAARRHSPAEAVELLDAADRGYGKLVIVQNAAERASPKVYGAGEFGGEELTRAAKGSDISKRRTAYGTGQARMQDYAAGAEALGEQIPKNISAEGMTQAGIGIGALGASGATGALVSPWAAAPLGYYALNTVANAPGVRDVANLLISPRTMGAARPVLNDIRYAAEMAAKYGGPMLIAKRTHEMPPMEGESQR